MYTYPVYIYCCTINRETKRERNTVPHKYTPIRSLGAEHIFILHRGTMETTAYRSTQVRLDLGAEGHETLGRFTEGLPRNKGDSYCIREHKMLRALCRLRVSLRQAEAYCRGRINPAILLTIMVSTASAEAPQAFLSYF